MSLDDAIKLVRAAGYRVTKPQPRRTKKTRVGPTCVAKFADGTVTRMSTHCDDAKLDWERGYALCVAAWRSRQRKRPAPLVEVEEALIQFNNDFTIEPPAVASIHFERDGVIIGQQQSEAA